MANLADRWDERHPAVAERARLQRGPAAALSLLGVLAAFLVVVMSQNGPPAAPAFLTDALGPPEPSAPFVRTVAEGTQVTIRPDGYAVAAGGASVSLAGEQAASDWRRFERGVSRPTPFGSETIVVDGETTELFLTVRERQGDKTWRWRLDAQDLEPRLGRDGVVSFLDGRRVADFVIPAVRILDDDGRDVTPSGLAWSLTRRDGLDWLELRLDDAKLALPYTIDPGITLRGAQGGNNGAGATSLTLTVPGGVQQYDVLLAQVTVRGGSGTTITPPACGCWTSIRLEQNGATLAQELFYKIAGPSDAGATYGWTITSNKASGGIVAYAGVENSAPIAADSGQPNGNSSTVTAPAVAPSMANAQLVGFFGSATGTGDTTNWSPPTGMTERWDQSSTTNGAPTRTSSEAADELLTASGSTGIREATNVSSAANIGQLVALAPDTTAPDTSIGSSPADPTNSTNATFTFSANEAGSTFECRLDAGVWTGCTTPKAYAGLSAGSHTFEVRATDPAGNADASPAVHPWTIDLTAPDTTIGSNPADPSNDADPSFSFSSSEAGSTFECQLDSGGWAACTSPKAYSGLSAGSHTFEVRATDAAGNTDSTPATYPWTIDLTDPDTSITASPSDPSNDAGPSFSFDSSEAGSSFECQLDAGGFGACSSPKSYAGLSAGSHTFEVRATDAAGNVDPTPATYTWTIDLTDPDTSVTAGPSDPSNDADPSFSFDSSEAGSTFECQLDSGGWGACASPKSYTGLAEGSHTFEVKATDTAGNVDSTPATHTWTIDLTEPNTSITAAPSDPSADPNPTFSFTSSEGGSTFECQLDAGGWTACTSSKSYVSLAEGSHTFEVRATDAAGNVDASPATHTWTIDLTEPNTSITAAPSDPSADPNPTFSFTSSEGGSTFECQLDAAGWTACASPKTYSSPGEGTHSFEVKATDTAGNTDSTPSSFTWTIDLTAPDTTIDSGPSDPSNDADPSFTFTSNEPGSSFQCQLDGGGWSACTSAQEYTGLAAGSHTFEVYATDAAGNIDATPATRTWTIDLTDPDTSITGDPSDPSNDAGPSFSFDSSEAGSTFECQLDSGGWGACSSPESYAGLSAGSHTFEVRATDAAGNVDGSPAAYTWTIDLTDPNTSIAAGPSDPSNDADPSFSFDSSETGSTFECRLDGGGWAACTSPKSYVSLAEGSHTFAVRATDAAGNVDASPATYAWTIDLTEPPAPTIDPPSPAEGGTSDDDVDLYFSDTEGGVTFECRIDGGVFAACSSPKSYSALAPGSHTFEVKARDEAGNESPVTSRTWSVSVAPETTITASPADPSNDPNPSFSFTSSEAESTFECQLDAGGWNACSSPQGYTGLSAGAHTFEVRAIDADSNVDPTPASHTWTIDLTDPNTSITASPSDPTNSTSASFSFDSNETGSTFECQLDSGGWGACSSPESYTGLAAGSHAFEVRATDAAGNVDPTPASYTWTIDLTDPDTSITASPSDPSNDTDPSFGFDSSEAGSSFQCQLDAGGWGACSSPKGYTGLAAGSHTFEVRATDAAGNVDASPATYTWTIDLTDPDTTITANPSDPSNDADPSFGFDSSEAGSTFECQLDEGGWAACTSPESFTALAEGSHTFEVRATDTAGNTDSSPATYTWTIDLSDPNTSITAAPSDPSADPNPTFSFTSSEGGSTFECQLDAGGWAVCTSPKTYSSLGAGSHTFEVRATDPPGNVDPTPSSFTWTIDLTAPETTITGNPSDPSNDAGPSFDFDSSEAGSSFQCQLDSSGWSLCSTDQEYSGLADGSHTFEVYATDAAGNVDPTPASYTWTIDLTDPETTITAGPSDPSNDADPSFGFDSSEAGSTFECRLDAGGWGACTSPEGYSGLAEGSHTFEVRATDAAGNVDPTPATHTWTIDLTDPDTSITAGPSDPSNDADPSFGFDSSEAGSTFECQIDPGGWGACTSPKSYAGLTAGSHTFEVRATDAAGNVDGSPATYSWTIDLTDPDTSVTAGPSDPSNDADPSFGFDSSEAGSSFECQLDAGGFGACSSPKSYAGLSAGSHTFDVRATDAAGNVDASPATFAWTIDLTDPNTSITAAPGDPTNSTSADFSFAASESGATFECELDGAGFSACTSPQTYPGPIADGSHTFKVRATDAAGNAETTPASYTWTVDTVEPSTTIDLAPSDPSNDSSATFEFSADEGGSTFRCELDGAGFSACTSPHTYPGPLADGSHTFKVRATDAAGNVDSTPATYTWTIDGSAPTVAITAPVGYVNASDGDPYTVTATSPDGDIASVEFFGCSDASVACSGGTWISLGPADSLAPYTASWNLPAADGNASLRAVATDTGGNTAEHVIDVTVDRAKPATTIDSGPADPTASTSAAFAFSADEPGAGFDCKLDGGSFAPCSSPASYAGLADGSHTFEVRATDAAGNVEPAPPAFSWTVDTTEPDTSIDSGPPDPSASAEATFSFSANEAGVSFQCKLDGDDYSPCASPASYSGLADGSHTLRVKAVDAAGNVDPTPATYTWTIDATPPSGGLADPGTNLRGEATLTASPLDTGGAGVKDVEFQYSPADAGAWVTIAVDASDPYSVSWDTTLTGDGLYDLRIVVTDNALNAFASPELEDRRVDNTAPNAVLDDPGSFLVGTVLLTHSSSDPGGSGVASASFERSPAGAGSWSPVPASWDTTTVPDGSYDLRVVVTDNAGNSSASSPPVTSAVDNTPPSLTSSTPADGSVVASASELTLFATETLAGVDAEIDGVAAAPALDGSSATYTIAFVDGPHVLAGELVDLAGNRTPIRVHFTVWGALAALDWPYTEKNSYAASDMTLAAASGASQVLMPAGGWSGGDPGDWIVVRIDPKPSASTIGSGFEAGGDIYDVIAYWALAGTEVHSFEKALDITLFNAASPLLPATLEGSGWRAIAPVPSGQTLPAGWQDGFYRDGGDLHILTRHLSSFTSLRDVQPPTKPGKFRGSRSNGRLVLRWAASADNSGLVAGYVVYANGSKIRSLGNSALSVDLGKFKTKDGRKFQVAARDATGNLSKKTYKLVIVPKLKGLTLSQATSKLEARGLKRGTVTYVSSSLPAGAVVSVSKSGVVRTGTVVALALSSGSSGSLATRSGATTGGGPTTGGGTPITGSGGFTAAPSSTPPVPAEGSEAGVDDVDIVPAGNESAAEVSSLRKLLGLLLLLAACFVAGLVARRTHRAAKREWAGAEPLELVFWDRRLAQRALTTVRRLGGGRWL